MKLNEFVNQWEPLAKLGGWLYAIVAAIVAVVAWVTAVQIAVAANSADIHDLKSQVRPIEAIRQDVRWIKKRLGGPDN